MLPVSSPPATWYQRSDQLVLGPANKPCEQPVVRAGPGHMYVCGQALLLGAMQATAKTTERLLESEADLGQVWEDEFARCSQVKRGVRAALAPGHKSEQARKVRAALASASCSATRSPMIAMCPCLPSVTVGQRLSEKGVLP